MMKRRCTSRARFSYSDDRAMLRFLVSEVKRGNDDAKNPFGNKIWESAVKKRILTDNNHTIVSIRDHFRRMLWPFLHFQAISLEEREFLKKNIRTKHIESSESSEVEEDKKEGETSSDDCYLFRVDSPKRKTVTKKKRVLVNLKRETSIGVKNEASKLSRQERPRRDHLRLNSEIVKLSPDEPKMSESTAKRFKPTATTADIRKEVVSPIAPSVSGIGDVPTEEGSQSVLDLSINAPNLNNANSGPSSSFFHIESP